MAYKRVFLDLRFFDEYSLLMNTFSFPVTKQDLLNAGASNVGENFLEFENEHFEKGVLSLINNGLSNLKNIVTKKSAVYLHKGLNIPLLGHVGFGLIDRGTNAVEVKPITGCNLKCLFCSVDQELRFRDFVIEEEFLISELEKLLAIKKSECYIFINAHGEPLFYSPLTRLIRDLKSNQKIKDIILITNASLLSKGYIDELIASGLGRMNISIHSLDKKKAIDLSGIKGYDLDSILANILYAKSKGLSVTITPVVLFSSKKLERQGIESNQKDMIEIARFCKENGLLFSPQNYLSYKLGKRVSKEKSFEDFYVFLDTLKKNFGNEIFELALDIKQDNSLKNPFRKGEIVSLKKEFNGLLENEAICVLRNRLVSVIGARDKNSFKVKIIRTKDNIIKGLAL